MKFKTTETIEYLHEAPDTNTAKTNYKTGTARQTFFAVQSIPELPPNPPVAAAAPSPAANPPASNEPSPSYNLAAIPAPAKALEPAPKP